MFFNALMTAATLVALAAAGPCSPPTDCQDICIDGINDCGVKYGGCYNICSPELSPTPPPCTPTDCPEVCMDGVNDCGVKYGGCYNACSPELEPTPPPCPSTTAPYQT